MNRIDRCRRFLKNLLNRRPPRKEKAPVARVTNGGANSVYRRSLFPRVPSHQLQVVIGHRGLEWIALTFPDAMAPGRAVAADAALVSELAGYRPVRRPYSLRRKEFSAAGALEDCDMAWVRADEVAV